MDKAIQFYKGNQFIKIVEYTGDNGRVISFQSGPIDDEQMETWIEITIDEFREILQEMKGFLRYLDKTGGE